MAPRIVIVGGGIGGLSCALALQRVGVAADVYEQASDLAPVGAGIGLWPGALHSLRSIGIDEAFWDLPVCRFERAETVRPDGRPLLGFDVAAMTGGDGFVVERSALQSCLANRLDPERIHTAARVTALEQRPGDVAVRFADGTSVVADVVIGADGLRSAVRAALFGETEPRYSGETCYRGLAPLSVVDTGVLREAQGDGYRAAVHPLSADRVYWWAARRAPKGVVETAEERRAVLLSRFATWRTGIAEAIDATPAQTILKNDLFDRPPLPRWSLGRVTLLGDAAHPTTPNLGLGGCMAIEDSLVLARAFAENDFDHRLAFPDYESQRHSRVEDVVRTSRLFGRLGSLRNPLAIAARSTSMRLIPPAMAARAFARRVGYDPGPLVR